MRLRILLDSIQIAWAVSMFCVVVCLALYPRSFVNTSRAFRISFAFWMLGTPYGCRVFYRRSKARFGTWLSSNDYQVCIECGYLLTRLPSEYTCPECGTDYEKTALAGLWLEWQGGATAPPRAEQTAEDGQQNISAKEPVR
ncbi:MAG: hypothetical protein IIB61_04630 [Planctomycetes bacterium]|nr:hypothetical protein [Planctomycetota bacterium]